MRRAKTREGKVGKMPGENNTKQRQPKQPPTSLEGKRLDPIFKKSISFLLGFHFYRAPSPKNSPTHESSLPELFLLPPLLQHAPPNCCLSLIKPLSFVTPPTPSNLLRTTAPL